jgi:hypothetical protein
MKRTGEVEMLSEARQLSFPRGGADDSDFRPYRLQRVVGAGEQGLIVDR